MKIRLLSDLHLEFGDFDVPELGWENHQVLVLAGDIGLADKTWTFKAFIREMADRFNSVVYIPGNHEYYKTSFIRGIDKLKDACEGLDNVHIGNDMTVVIDDTAFICSTLWADCNKQDPITMWHVGQNMNDFKYIRHGTKAEPYKFKFSTHDYVVAHEKSKSYIFDEIPKHKAEGRKVVVVTHHAPSSLSIHPRYARNDLLNGAYVSDLSEEILDTKPDLWVHGHMHDSFDYMIGDTRVVVNPRGYHPSDLNPDFNPELVLEV